MHEKNIIGIDIGGTNLRAAIVNKGVAKTIISEQINSFGSKDEVLQQLFFVIDKIMDTSVNAIGIGVPGLVLAQESMVYDVINIPAWKEIALQKIVEEKYKVPVLVENDANCFSLGEFYFGKGKNCNSFIGLTIGTGLGSGIIINKKLYTGANGGAGEFGMMPYLDKNYEYYASGQYFKNIYNQEGELVFEQANKGNKDAIKKYEEMGAHLGNAIKAILYALDIELIVLGGSVRHAFSYFQKAMWNEIKTIEFNRVKKNIKVEVSQLENAGILGASSLHLT